MKYVKDQDENRVVIHATIPCGDSMVECEALCGESFYPPWPGQQEPVLLEVGQLDCPACLAARSAISR